MNAWQIMATAFGSLVVGCLLYSFYWNVRLLTRHRWLRGWSRRYNEALTDLLIETARKSDALWYGDFGGEMEDIRALPTAQDFPSPAELAKERQVGHLAERRKHLLRRRDRHRAE